MNKITIKDIEIIVPDHKGLIKKLNTLSSMNLYFINRYQQEQRHFPNSGAGCEDYCLYMGSMEETHKNAKGKEYIEKCDLWHYPYYLCNYPRYSTGIITGNNAGEYKSGWPSLSLSYDSYKTLLRREVICGLVTEPKIIVELGLAALNLRPDMSEVQYNQVINEAGGGVNHHDDGYEFDYVDADWWHQHWYLEQLEQSEKEGLDIP